MWDWVLSSGARRAWAAEEHDLSDFVFQLEKKKLFALCPPDIQQRSLLHLDTGLDWDVKLHVMKESFLGPE